MDILAFRSSPVEFRSNSIVQKSRLKMPYTGPDKIGDVTMGKAKLEYIHVHTHTPTYRERGTEWWADDVKRYS